MLGTLASLELTWIVLINLHPGIVQYINTYSTLNVILLMESASLQMGKRNLCLFPFFLIASI